VRQQEANALASYNLIYKTKNKIKKREIK